MRYTVTRTVTIVERWHNIEAASHEDAEALVEDGHVVRLPDHEDGFGEIIDAEEATDELGTYTLVGEFTEDERTGIARVFSTTIPTAEHASWTITNGHGIRCSCTAPFNNGRSAYCATQHGGIVALFAASVSPLCRSLEDVYLGHSIDESGN